MNQKTAFIINPAAGFGKTKKRIKTLAKLIKGIDPEAKILLTRHPLHAMSLAKHALKEGVLRLVVIGGDGTLNEVINGYFDGAGKAYNEHASIAIVPSGTGSDFIRSIEHKKDLHEAIKFALHAPAKPTDVGLVEATDTNGLKVKRYFINVSSAGLSGLVAGFMKTVTRKLGSTSAYFIATVQAIRALKPSTLKITAEGFEQTIENCSLLSFANGQFFGSGMKIAPNARLDDGLFDVIGIKDLGALFFMVNGYRVYQGTHLELANVQSYRHATCTVTALTTEPVYIETDGELFAQLPATYSVQHNAVLMVR